MNDKFEYYLLVIRCYWPFILLAVSVILTFMPNDTLHEWGLLGIAGFVLHLFYWDMFKKHEYDKQYDFDNNDNYYDDLDEYDDEN